MTFEEFQVAQDIQLIYETKQCFDRYNSPLTGGGDKGAGPCFHHTQKRVPCPSRVLCERAGLLADIAAADHRIQAELLAAPRCPVRFNLDRTLFPSRIVEGTAPLPIFRTSDQPALDRVLMHIIQFLGQFRFTPNIEVIIPGLPEGSRRAFIEFLRNNLLEHLQHNRQVASLRLAQQQMHVLGHNHKSGQVESVPTTYSFQRDNECVACSLASQQRRAAITTERNEMNVTSLLVSPKSPWHEVEITSWRQVSAVTDEHRKYKVHKSCGRG